MNDWHAIIAIIQIDPFLDLKNLRAPVSERKEEFKLLVEICDKVLISVG